jgi:phosphoglycerate dehydrogenase-like enzyme
MNGAMRVAVLDDYQQVAAGLADWGRLAGEVVFFSDHLDEDASLVERLAGFDVIVAMRERTPFDRPLLTTLPNLRLLVTTGSRNSAIDMDAAKELGVLVCGTASSGHATAELSFALIQMLARSLMDEITGVRGGEWQLGLGRDLKGSVLGVVGLGRVGAQVAAYGLAFGMDVVAWSQNLTAERCEAIGVRQVAKQELLTSSDFVTLHLKLGPRSVGVIGAADLFVMKPTAYLVNTSRGPLVDTEALVAALDAGAIAGAALDVFEPEPLPVDHPLRHHPKILPTPHIGYVTEQTYQIFYPEALEDIEAWRDGSPIRVL